MKRSFIFGLVIGLVLAGGQVAHASNTEEINSFDTTVAVNPDSTIQVKENIAYDFGPYQRHGIFRDIPVDYQTSFGNQSITLKNISITDGNGLAENFTTSKVGSSEEIKIGDPNILLNGVHVYHISYTVERAIGYFNSLDEIYWNATGNQWPVPILHSSAIVSLPTSIPTSSVKASCYYGPLGSTTQCQGAFVLDIGGRVQAVSFSSPGLLEAGSGLTVAIGFPKGIVQVPSGFSKILSFISDNIIVLVPLFVFLAMLGLWWKKGRDPKGSGVLVAEYDTPDNLTPLELAGILKTKIANDKISAEIIYLATRGYIKISRIEKKELFISHTDYELTLLKVPDGLISSFDQELLNGIFSPAISTDALPPPVLLSTLKNHFYSVIPVIQKSVYESLTTKGYYKKNPQTVMNPYRFLGSIFFVIIYILFRSKFFYVTMFSSVGTVEMIAVFIISFLIIEGFGKIMPSKTEQGAQAMDKILGLKEYLQIAEKDRINFHDAPDKNPALFEKLLPYAMVLGVEKAWAKEFEGIYTTAPSWYNDPYQRGMFNAMLLTNSLGSFNSVAVSSFSSRPGGSLGSGGGGFSGGGGGGGGGGSW